MLCTLFSALLLFFVGTSVSGQNCNCQSISHPQRRLCEAKFAFRGEILNAIKAPLPGDVDDPMRNKNLEYKVRVSEIFKGESQYITQDVVSLFTPTGGLCGNTGLLDAQKLGDFENDYLFTGDIAVTSKGNNYLVITNCNWVEKWVDINEEQEEGLNGMYSDCQCVIESTSSAVEIGKSDADNFQIEDCLFNPISAVMLRVPDCESNFGYCMEEEDYVCRWTPSPTFDQCFSSRDERLTKTGQAAAITRRKHCHLLYEEGRQRKKCLLKLKHAKNG